MIATKKQLAMILSRLQHFERPKMSLEQYPTESEIAAELLWSAHMRGEIAGKTVADLGAGTGILGIGALLLGAKKVYFVERDPAVLPTLRGNLEIAADGADIALNNYEIINDDVAVFRTTVDLAIQNPPFGTKEKHADLRFLEAAIAAAPIVYSLHKTSTETYLRAFIEKRGLRITQAFHFTFPLKQSLPQHRKRIMHIDVAGLKIEK